MNVAVRPLAADLPHRRFTTADVARMVEAGIMGEDERVELIDGELVEMAAKGSGHDVPKSDLGRLLMLAVAPEVFVGIEITLRLSDEVLVEPDVVAFPRSAMQLDQSTYMTVDGTEVLLVIEVAVTSLAYDLGAKAAVFARHGVQELWVVDLRGRRVVVHARPGENGWEAIEEHGPDVVLTPHAPQLAAFHLTLAHLLG